MKGTKTGGRKKGTPNKTTQDVKEAILTAFHRAGGADYLSGIAASHPQVFCTLIGKIVPAEVKAEVTGMSGPPSVTEIVIEQRTAARGDGGDAAAPAVPPGADTRVELKGTVRIGTSGDS